MARLARIVERLHGRVLDRRRPPWECDLIASLSGNRFAVSTKMHHGLVDGMAGVTGGAPRGWALLMGLGGLVPAVVNEGRTLPPLADLVVADGPPPPVDAVRALGPASLRSSGGVPMIDPRSARRLAALALLLVPPLATAAPAPDRLVERVAADRATNARIARQIWEWAEVGYQETRSSALLADRLEAAGFAVERGVAGIPTAFVAEIGAGEPVIALLGEFDALPGITQSDAPVRDPRTDVGAGHACGHHLFGTASASAAIAVAEWLAASGREGTVRFYGTPAEEGGAGKVYLVRAGLFEDVDVALHWHPGDGNSADARTSNANRSAKFRFHGQSAHAASAPHRGRSALDGVEAMNHMTNLMREHVPQDARIHYVITEGGAAPNVTPDFSEVFYYTRHPDPDEVRSIFDRVVAAAEGAALGTGTTVDFEIIHGLLSLLPNETLQRRVHAHLERVGGVEYDDEQRAFAERLRASLGEVDAPLAQASAIDPFSFGHGHGSTDVGDVSWVVPTAGLYTATWVPGTSAHSWQAVAAGGTEIGVDGMQVAAKVLALTAAELLSDPALVAEARSEFEARRGPDWVYEPLLGDRDPPLDYRD
jgi:aminobenzoyl-glutamate utilization protein B